MICNVRVWSDICIMSFHILAIAFLARRTYATMSVSVCLSVMEVHWRIRANLGFKFRSKFTANCGRGRGNLNNNISRYASHCLALLFVYLLCCVLRDTKGQELCLYLTQSVSQSCFVVIIICFVVINALQLIPM